MTSETDSLAGSDQYSLQLNTNTFSCSSAYTNNVVTNCWEQFVYQTNALGIDGPGVYLDYTLTGYVNASAGRPSCPSTGPPGGSGWYVFSTQPANCYANSAIVAIPALPITELGSLVLYAYADYEGSGNDVVQLCVSGGTCYSSASNPDNVLNLSQNWEVAEFNVFGLTGGSVASFNTGTEITVSDVLTDQNGNPVSPSCAFGTTTGETNNLYLGTCTNSSSGITFTEGNFEFSISVGPSDATVLSGQTASYVVSVTLLAGASEPVSLSVVSGLPSGALATFSPAIVSPNGTSDLAVSTSSSGGLGDFTFTVEGEFSGVTEIGTANLHVYDFTVDVAPSDQTVLRGGSTEYAVSLILAPGSSTTGLPAVQLSESGLPSDASYAFSASAIVPTFAGCSSSTLEDCQTLTVTTAGTSSGSLGDYPFAVIGADPSASGGSRAAFASLHIFDFRVDVAPSDQTVLRGTSATYTVNLTLVPGSSAIGIPAFSLGVSGLPSDATYAFSAGSIVPTLAGCSFSTLEDCQSLKVTTKGPTTGSLGDFTFTVSASASGPGNGSRSGSANLHIFDFKVSLAPASVTLVQGGSAEMTVTLTLVPGSSTFDLPSIALTLGGVPVGVVAVGFPSTLSIGASQTFTLQTAGVGSYVSCPQVSSHGGQNLKGANLAHCDLVGYDLAFDNLQGANLSYADLANAVLTGANLQGASLASANTSGAEFLGANLAGADLSSATPIGVFLLTASGSVDGASRSGTSTLTVLGDQLSGDNFELANLGKADLYGDVAVGAKFPAANLFEADLADTDLAGANFLLADLGSADIAGSNLNGTGLQGAYLWGADLAGDTAVGASFQAADLGTADLEGDDLAGANFTLADLQAAILIGTDLDGTSFGWAYLYEADLYGATGIGANFQYADLVHANLAGGDFASSDFRGVSAQQASFAGDDLVNTNFVNANLAGSDLADANLTGANLHGAILTGANTTGTVF